ncbi:protein FAM187B-like [Chiloscyllium plagiosum]|uniref:protein FAM187B-like n=1 Tax=Chiloscyllium plagiosum TaxID=36176 RepID=UPI001CB877E4|nr:protein FAM187B-like [Chiloscyllium plagiosum]
MLVHWPVLVTLLWFSCWQVVSLGTAISCSRHRLCQIALVSSNPVLLVCVDWPRQEGELSWFYMNSSEPESGQVRLLASNQIQGAGWDLQSDGLLLLHSPTIWDSGIYLCRAGAKTLTYYEVDVQDVKQLHLSGGLQGGTVLPNLRAEVGGQGVYMFTVWSPWGRCDHCGVPGYRRRLGFCYAQSSSKAEDPMPCGLLSLGPQKLPPRGPELSLEACHVPCQSPSVAQVHHRHLVPGGPLVLDNDNRVLLFETYLVNVHSKVTFHCPDSSIYSPATWQRELTQQRTRTRHPRTSRGLSQQMEGSHSLDQAIGSSTYTIQDVEIADEGIYRCFISDRLAASFHLKVFRPFRRRMIVAHRTMALIWYILLSLGVVSLLLVMLTFLYAFCSYTRRHQLIQW